jgi:hypothetical protein
MSRVTRNSPTHAGSSHHHVAGISYRCNWSKLWRRRLLMRMLVCFTFFRDSSMFPAFFPPLLLLPVLFFLLTITIHPFTINSVDNQTKSGCRPPPSPPPTPPTSPSPTLLPPTLTPFPPKSTQYALPLFFTRQQVARARASNSLHLRDAFKNQRAKMKIEASPFARSCNHSSARRWCSDTFRPRSS